MKRQKSAQKALCVIGPREFDLKRVKIRRKSINSALFYFQIDCGKDGETCRRLSRRHRCGSCQAKLSGKKTVTPHYRVRSDNDHGFG